MSRILFDAFDSSTPVVPPSGPSGVLLDVRLGGESGYVHRVEYWTEVLKARSGLETRTRLLAKPRDTVEFEVLVAEEDVFRILRRQRVFEPTAIYLVPMRHEGAAVRGAVTSSSISVDNTYLEWLVPGQRVLVESPGGSYEAVVQSSGAGPGVVSVVLDQVPPGGVAFPDGAVVVFPVRPFYVMPESAVQRYAVGAGSWAVTLRGVEPVAAIATASTVITTLGGLPILAPRPEAEGLGSEERAEGQVGVHDYEARLQLEWHRDEADVFRQHTWRISSTADRQYFRKFLETVAGRQKAFLLPTWRRDFEVASNSGTSVTLDDDGAYAADWFPGAAHRYVRLVAPDGTEFDREVTAATGTTQSVLTLGSSVGVSVEYATLIEKVRLAQDAVDFVYRAGVQGAIQMGCLVVQR